MLAAEERDDVLQTIERLRSALEDLAVRGLQAAGEKDLRALDGMAGELERIGAGHLAGRVNDLLAATRARDRASGAALLRAHTSLRLLEWILSLETAAEMLERAGQVEEGEGEE